MAIQMVCQRSETTESSVSSSRQAPSTSDCSTGIELPILGIEPCWGKLQNGDYPFPHDKDLGKRPQLVISCLCLTRFD